MLPNRSRAARVLRLFVLAIAGSVLCPALPAQDGANDPTFNAVDSGDYGDGVEAGGSVYAVAVQPNGKSIIAGHFVYYHDVLRPRLARLESDGGLDPTFVPPQNPGTINALAIQPDGKIVIGGYGPVNRLNADGSIDASFQVGTGPNGVVHAIALQPDGKILFAGDFTSWNNVARGRIARVHPDGTLDASFAPPNGASGAGIRSIALLPDGRAIVGGGFLSYDGVPRNALARIHVDGSLDASFDAQVEPFRIVRRVLALPNGYLLVAGDFTSVGGLPRSRIARLLPHGGVDANFDPGTGPDSAIFGLELQADGKAVIGGSFTSCSGAVRDRIARLNGDGSLDTSFAFVSGANSTILTVALQADGRALIGGPFTTYAGVVRRGITRLNLDASRDATFNPGAGASGLVRDVALQADGQALIGGDFTHFNGLARNRVARLGLDGTPDPTFGVGAGADGAVWAVQVQPDGRVLVGGSFTTYDGVARTRLARSNADGSIDAGFVPGLAASSYGIEDIALQTDGKVVIGGTFATAGHSIVGVARLNSDGSLDGSFAVGFGVNDSVHAVLLQPDGKVLAAGRFTTYRGVACNRLVRLESDGSLDASFAVAAGADFAILALAVQPDGRVLLGGDFNHFGAALRPKIARILADGTFDAGFAPNYGPDRTVRALRLQADGHVLLGGDFTSVDFVARARVARLRADGSNDASFDPGAGSNAAVHDIALQQDGRAVLAGDFTRYDGAPRHRVARITATVPEYATYCFGFGGTPCPCGNSGGAGNGCASSLNPAGAHFGASGSASLANDTLVLEGSGMPDSSALYFQGTAPQNGGLGTLFGDGLRCVGGSVTRLGTRFNSAGASAYPAAGDAPVSVRGNVAAPGVRHYQVWYRNAASFCTPSTFNLTNGLTVIWRL